MDSGIKIIDRGQNIESFAIEGSKFVPYSLDHRANILLDGDSDKCPFNRFSFTFRYQISEKDAQERVQSGSYDFCWNSCEITECPSYKANRS